MDLRSSYPRVVIRKRIPTLFRFATLVHLLLLFSALVILWAFAKLGLRINISQILRDISQGWKSYESRGNMAAIGKYDPVKCNHEDCFCDGCEMLDVYTELVAARTKIKELNDALCRSVLSHVKTILRSN
jgi:hypothetical protein